MKTMKKDLFVCHTYYHILLSLILINRLEDNLKPDMILSSTIPGFEKLKSKLIKQDIYSSIRIIYEDDGYREIGFVKKTINYLFNQILFFESEELKNIDVSVYDNCYVFHDSTFIGMKILRQAEKIHLCEDGKRHYPYIEDVIYKRSKFKKILKDILVKLNLRYDQHGRSDKIRSYYITNEENIVNWMKSKQINIIKTDEISEKTIEIIKEVMIDEDSRNISNNDKKAIILTQPLYQDGFVKTQEEQLALYEKIVIDIKEQFSVFIKPHPRDELDYSKILEEVKVLSKDFPIEVFNFTNVEFDLGCTIGSSSIHDNQFIKEIKEYKELITWY